MQKLRLKHLLAIRWFHWINFPLLLIMIWSGFLIYWAYPIYTLGPISIVPKWLFTLFDAAQRLGQGMALHFVFMWLFLINGLLYVGYTLISGEWRLLVPRSFSAFRDAMDVALYDLHLKKTLPPKGKYNAAQQITYTAIILMGAGSILTGLSIYKPVQFSWLAACFGGYASARFIHFYLTVGYVLFFVVHVAQVILAGWNNFRAMLIGYELVKEND